MKKRYKNFLQHRLLSSIKNIFNIMGRKGTSVKSNSFGRQQSSPFPCIAIVSTTPTSTTSLSTSSPFSVADNSVKSTTIELVKSVRHQSASVISIYKSQCNPCHGSCPFHRIDSKKSTSLPIYD